jgi:hypothetical protein
MKYGRLAWITAQGLTLIVASAYGLLLVKQRYVEASHAMSEGVFDLLMLAILGGAFLITRERAMKEIRRLKREAERR